MDAQNRCAAKFQQPGRILNRYRKAGGFRLEQIERLRPERRVGRVAAMNGLLIADNDTLATANEVELIDAFNNNLALRDLRPLGTWSNQEVAVNNTLSVFPNPASSSVSVELNENSKIEIIDITGKLVYSANNAQAGMHTIDVNAFAKGTYAIRISNQASVQTAKFIKN